ncbi:hypothetical protein [Neptuniibacter caesariensis]|uniref:Uncharacterized protein n=1 Tax=Neptuniibacter caesariensis TaxID=207954 RepID=A0A7U8C7D6_NEPCE|nr:hypothetical protein [Neptuniibacter caesariensis]EAR62654.1 hypothetical protein MED92_06033 [Oceanospirillum sp. MED92] [Neptuniibacter caesariensis]
MTTFLLLIFLTIVPVMISARVFNAANTSFFPCLIAVIASAAAYTGAGTLISNEGLSFVASIALTALMFSMILGAKYMQSVFIALLTVGIQLGVVVAYSGAIA